MKKLQSGSLPKAKGRRFTRVQGEGGAPRPPTPPMPPPPKPPRLSPPRRRWLEALVTGFFIPLFVFAFFIGWEYRAEVVDYNGPEFEREAILAVIAQESPVYYKDGKTRLGVFFDQEHRQYIRFADLPKDWVNAIVAAEDGNFFHHPGVDPKHVLRAAWTNLQAGRVVAGGSTLTQQTAKNLFYRPDRSWKSKWTELMNALRLERRYSKEDILEFYANQFHVSANGRGLGIGARYFFDKDVKALSLKECAFLAGLVKAPSRYNPFLGSTPERREEARKAAEDRTSYVLRRMLEDGYIDERQFQAALTTPLNFSRGTFQYDRSVVLDSVQALLEEPTFVELFEKTGIDNPSTAGIQIITTLDPTVQRESTWGLWHHLSEIGPLLERSAAWALSVPSGSLPPPEAGASLVVHEFYYGRVRKQSDEGLLLDLSGRPCLVDAAAEKRMGEVLARARTGNPNASADATAMAALRTELAVDKVALVSVKQAGDDARCDLELRPKLQGALVVLEDGQLRALVGGNDNRNFDRALDAQRQLGSTWKPLVYNAALHLGWLPDDVLDNRRNVFPFRDVWYYPHPDHPSDPFVTMSLSGARSENLASVWLLAHLTDRLDSAQFSALAQQMRLLPTADEPPTAWMRRMRDEEALRSSPDRFEEYAFTLARQDVLANPPFADDVVALRSLLHGQGTAAERARLEATEPSDERTARLEALQNTLLSLESAAAACRKDPTLLWDDPLTGEVACSHTSPGDAWARRSEPVETPPDPEIPPDPSVSPTPEPDTELPGVTRIEGRLRLGTIEALRAATDKHLAELSGRDPWDPEVLVLNPDFRTLVGIRWLQHLAAAYGVRAKLPTVLSLPLGAADITLVEAAVMYQGFLKGQRWNFPGDGFGDGAVAGMRDAYALPDLDVPAGLIAEVRDARGNVLYRARPAATEVADPEAGELVGDILRNVVRVGTARRAREALKVDGVPVPLAGKTGTTNDYRNAAFVGFVPKVAEGAAHWGNGYTIAAYVGYDDNRSMRRGSVRMMGASGALPAWLGAAQGLVQAGLLGMPTAGADFVPSTGLEIRPVVENTGFPREGTDPGPTTLVPVEGKRHYAIPGLSAADTPAPVEAPPTVVVATPTEALPPEEGVETPAE